MSSIGFTIRAPSLSTFWTPFFSYFHPTIDALIVPSLPLHIRIRLLAFQPVALLGYLLNHIPCHLLSPRPPRTIYIPVRNGRTLRALLYLPSNVNLPGTAPPRAAPHGHQSSRHPVHIDIHGGAFAAGHPESDHRFCSHLSQNDRFIVISTSYRFAPRHPFPAALEDIQDVVEWVQTNAHEFGGDANAVTVGGSSAGGTLALAVASEKGLKTPIKGVITFYAPVDLTIPPTQKPRPPEFPRFDPMNFFLPVFDIYAEVARNTGHVKDARLSPYLSKSDKVPENLLMVVSSVDILAKEQLDFIVRVNKERENQRVGKKQVEFMLMMGHWHGWLELPSMFVDENARWKIFEKCAAFLKKVHEDR